VAIAVAATSMSRRTVNEAVPPIRFVLATPDSTRPLDNFPWPATISPDGRLVVFSVGQRGLGSMFYSQRTDQLEARPIPGTTGAYQPYFSPDGQWLAFQMAGKERKVRLDGSAPVTIADGGSANGATWTINDEIVSGANLNFTGLGRVNAAGGTMTEFTHTDTAKSEKQHVWPIAMPDGKHVAFTIWYGALESSQLALASLDDGRVRELGIKGIRPLAVIDDRLVYVQADGTVMAVEVDAAGGRIIGNPVPVHDPVPVIAANNGNSGAFVSPGGALVTSRGNIQSQLTWLTLDGTRRVIFPEIRAFTDPVLSPDERKIAVLVVDDRRTDVWVYDLATTTFSRLTTTGTITSVQWTPDGAHVVYGGRGERERSAIWRQRSSGGSAAEKLLEVGELAPSASISPDGRWLVYTAYHNNTWDIYRVALDSGERTPQPYVATSANENAAKFSPNGKWVAFLSDESTRGEVYVRSFPDPSSRVQVSAEGAQEPTWSKDGRKIYYRSGSSLLAASIELVPTFRVVRRDTVTTTQFSTPLTFGATYDMSRDGKRMVSLQSNRDDFQLVVSPNWITEFRQRLAASSGNTRR